MKYDVIHFEALGSEAIHLKDEMNRAIKDKKLPDNFNYLVVTENLQTFLQKNRNIKLPDLITTKTHSILPKYYLAEKKRSIITRSAGYDHFEHLQSIINLASLREYCIEAVSQTAIKLLYATAGRLNEYARKTEIFERNEINSFLQLGKHVMATVFGAGKIGLGIYKLLVANNLSVQAVDIREKELREIYHDSVKFVSKEEALRNSDIIINVMNLTKEKKSRFYNIGYFSEKEFDIAKKGVIFINVTRGEIAPESVLLKYYKKGIISGIGLDVFSNEAAFSKFLKKEVNTDNLDSIAAKEIINKSISQEENFYVQPHQGFNSDIASSIKAKETIKHICDWYKNQGKRFNEQLPYYLE